MAQTNNLLPVAQFSVLLGLVFILEFAAGISGYVLRSDTAALLTKTMNYTLHQYQLPEYKYIALGWDEVQRDVNDATYIFNGGGGSVV